MRAGPLEYVVKDFDPFEGRTRIHRIDENEPVVGAKLVFDILRTAVRFSDSLHGPTIDLTSTSSPPVSPKYSRKTRRISRRQSQSCQNPLFW